MKTTPSKPSQACSVALNGQSYSWDSIGGLDPAAALGVVGFVRKKAWGYNHRVVKAGLDFEDLVQEGMAGALKAAAKYNPEAGASYLTYAATWIDAAMKEALNRPIIRTPEGESFAQVDSLDAPVGGGDLKGGRTFMDWQHSDQPSANDLSAAAEDRVQVRKALHKLDRQQREVLVRHLGLNEGKPQTLQAIARDMGLTRQRAMQILNLAQAELKQRLKGHVR